MPSLSFDRITKISFPGESISPITEGIVNGTLCVREILCSNRLAFGDINSNQFQCQLYDCPDLTGKKIQIEQTKSNGTDPVTVFTGRVDSCKTDEISGFKTIIAYDMFYYMRKKKIKSWWNSFWANGVKQSTIGNMWRSMLTYYSISYTDTTLLADNLVFKRTKQNKKIRTKSITTFLCQLCELSMAIPKIDRDGTLVFYKLYEKTANDVIDIRGYYTKSKSKIEDYKVTPYTKIELYDSNNKLKASEGSGNNLLSIKNNMLLYGQQDDYFTTHAANMYLHMHTIEYYPANITFKVAQLDIKLGDIVQTDKGYCIVSENNYTGSCLVDQSTVSTDQNEYQSGGSSSDGMETSLGDTLEREDNRLQYEIDNKNSNYVDDLDLSDLGDLGMEGDFYTKTGTNVLELHGLDRNTLHWYGTTIEGYQSSTKERITTLKWTNQGYQVEVSGSAYFGDLPNGYCGTAIIKLTGIRSVGKHNFHIKISHTRNNEVSWGNADMGIAFTSVGEPGSLDTPFSNGNPDTFERATGTGGVLSIGLTESVVYEYEDWFNVQQEDVTRGYIWVWFIRDRAVEQKTGNPPAAYTMSISEFYVWHENETYTTDDIDKMFVSVEKKDENSVNVRGVRALRSAGNDEPQREWKEIKYLSDVDDGMHLEGKKIFLDSNILRMWFHANPPQIDREFNQLCARFTGEPASGVTISKADVATDWSYGKCKKDKEGIYTITNSGDYTSGSIQQIAYKIEGLSVGIKYYFNFRCAYGNATFGNDTTKSLGIVFSTSSSVSTTSYSGEPHTFDETNLYASFYRKNGNRYYDFSFEATATTMYMIFVFGDVTGGTGITVTADSFIISREEKKYARSLYMYDTEDGVWVKYRPFGMSGDDDGESDISYLSELNDVTLTNPANNDVLKYDSATGMWINGVGGGGVADYPDLTNKPSVNSVTLLGNKTTRDLGMIQELTQAEYNNLTSAEKNNPDKVYYVKDAGGSGGGGGGSSTFAGLSDVDITSPTNGQVPTYNATSGKWENATPSGGTGTVRYDENTRFIQVLDHGTWLNAYRLPFFTNLLFSTAQSVNTTYTFSEEGDYLIWSSCCAYEQTSTSKITTTATVVSSNEKHGIDSDYMRTSEYKIVHAEAGDTATINVASYDTNSVGIIKITGLTLTEEEFEFTVDGSAQLSQTYDATKKYLTMLITCGGSRSISGNGNAVQSWMESYNSIDYIEYNGNTVSYDAWGYAGGSGSVIVFEVS